jgi:hypothetical protein
VDQFQRIAFFVFVFFEDPGLYQRATIGESDLVDVVLDDGLGLSGCLFRRDGTWSRGVRYGRWLRSRWCCTLLLLLLLFRGVLG